MAENFLKWVREAMPDARIQGNVVTISAPSWTEDAFTYWCDQCGGLFKSDITWNEAMADGSAFSDRLLCDVCFREGTQ